jgi:hypothetical protein
LEREEGRTVKSFDAEVWAWVWEISNISRDWSDGWPKMVGISRLDGIGCEGLDSE